MTLNRNKAIPRLFITDFFALIPIVPDAIAPIENVAGTTEVLHSRELNAELNKDTPYPLTVDLINTLGVSLEAETNCSNDNILWSKIASKPV